MKLIQALLVIAFLIFLIKFIADPNSYRTKAWKKIIGILFVLVAIVAVLVPDMLNKAAHVVGVGRGADLLLYLLTLAFIFTSFNNYASSRQEQKRLVKLARRMAITEANQERSK